MDVKQVVAPLTLFGWKNGDTGETYSLKRVHTQTLKLFFLNVKLFFWFFGLSGIGSSRTAMICCLRGGNLSINTHIEIC